MVRNRVVVGDCDLIRDGFDCVLGDVGISCDVSSRTDSRLDHFVADASTCDVLDGSLHTFVVEV